MIPAKIQDYIDFVRSGKQPMCKEQLQLVALVERTLKTENVRVDMDQAERYLAQQKHFPYRLMLWEEFIFILHNCAYMPNGQLRWPNLAAIVGRGSGKNGYLSFEDFCLLTPINGIREYHIDIFAMSEDQAKTSFDDIRNILEAKPDFFKKYFEWTKEYIKNLKTGSILRYRSSNTKTSDSMRPGKLDTDEYHALVSGDLGNTTRTGLGKKPHPRRTIISSFGNVRDGPFDRLISRAEDVLSGSAPDGGWLYFICRLDSDDEIKKPECWAKANPSLYDPTRPQLLHEIQMEFQDYLADPAENSDFATKRMGRPTGNPLTIVTDWDNILAASRPLPAAELLYGRNAVAGVDYASTQDFVAAGILMLVEGTWVWITHSWMCLQSKTLSYIKFPYREAAARGELTLVDAPEIHPDLPVEWIAEQKLKYNLLLTGIDHFRFTILSKSFSEHQFSTERRSGNIKLTYTPEQSKVAPLITSAFINHKLCWGDSMMMRWYTNNAIRIIDTRGNISYGKIEPKSRKTDGFMAMVMAFVCADIRMDELDPPCFSGGVPDVYVY